jgi:two-component system, LuxR family, response regulator FixJ
MPGPRIYLIDDQEPVRHALGEMLSVFGFEVQTFESADHFLAFAPTAPSGCIVADVKMPGTDGIQLVGELGRRKLTLPVVLISGHADVPMAVAAIKSGAEDFIEKPVDDVKLIAAVNRALARTLVAEDIRRAQTELAQRIERLTPRETEIFDLVVQGYTSHAIGEKLAVSIRTVESHRAQIMEKMQAESVAVLVRQAIRLGRISP